MISGKQWLKDAFEFEFCDECLGDAMHHTAVPFMDSYFGYCDYPLNDNGEMNSVVKDYHILAGNFYIFDN